MSLSGSSDFSFSEFRHFSESSTAGQDFDDDFSSYESSSEEQLLVARELGVSHLDSVFTERFQVDGRRLQRMLATNSEVKDISKAEMFFEDVMKKTETYICWPKKVTEIAGKVSDPQVQVYGKQDDLSWAKGLVLNTLDTKDKRQKLRIIIPNNDHRFMVGRENNNLDRIMEVTASIVEMPYATQKNMAQKGNQVTIEGSLDGIEQARASLRGSMPLLMSFEVPVGYPEPQVDHIKEVFQVHVTVTRETNSSLITVRGSVRRIDVIKEAIRQMINFIFNEQALKPLVSVLVEIPPLYQDFVKGEDNLKLLHIMETTKTTIFFPDLTINGNNKQRSQVTIIGTIEGVCKARQDLVNNYPVELTFDIPGSYQSNATEILNIGTRFGVSVTVGQKEQDSGLTVVIKGIEIHIEKIYEAYHEIIALRSAVPNTGEVPKAFYLLEAAYQRMMGELVHKYIETVAERTNFAMTQFQGITNIQGNPDLANISYGYIQAAHTGRELEQFCTSHIEQSSAPRQTTYTPDSGNDSDAVPHGDNQPKEVDIGRILDSLSLDSSGSRTDETGSSELAALQGDFQLNLPLSDVDSHFSSPSKYAAIYAGSAAPGAERHIIAEMQNIFPPDD